VPCVWSSLHKKIPSKIQRLLDVACIEPYKIGII
jgi:hypothetical protein